MGNRYTKILKLNGIVVGEYLGSDDPVNSAFSIELYLKTNFQHATGSANKGHELVALHDALPEACRHALQAKTVELAAQHSEAPTVVFRNLVVMLNNAFVKWRYVYEHEHSGHIYLQQTILAMHACRDVTHFLLTGKAASP